MPKTLESRFLTSRYAQTGTRFGIYPQPNTLRDFRRPKIVYVDAKPGTIKPGPEDERMYVVDALDKKAYVDTGERPPYTGRSGPKAHPGPRGHFAHLRPGTRALSSAMLFATVKCVLDIWEHYFGRELPWHFRDTYRRLELIPRVLTNTAWSQPGYIECGFYRGGGRRQKPFAENFDAVAHEMGHHIVHSVIDEPPRPKPVQYRALDEGLADLVAAVSSLHFESVVDHLLRHTCGNLFSVNVLSRIGELSESEEIRKVFNEKKMSGVKRDPIPDRYKFTLAAPFTGGAYDVLVEIYEDELVRRRAISQVLGDRSYEAVPGEVAGIQREFAGQFKRKKKAFKDALLAARDYFGKLLARTLDRTTMHDPSFPTFVANMLEADAQLSGGRYRGTIRESFLWREILRPGPDE